MVFQFYAPSSPPSHSYSSLRTGSVLSIGAGALPTQGIVFVLYYFDRTIKTKEQIEKLGLPILGTIQELKGGK